MPKPSHILARKSARTRLYAALYGPCAKGVPHYNKPWLDSHRGHSAKPSKLEFEAMLSASGFDPIQSMRVRARFAQMEG